MIFGGTEGQLRRLMEGLDPQRYEPHLCTLTTSDFELDVPGLCLHFRSFAHPGTFGVLHRLTSYLRAHEIELVQTFFQDPFVLGAMTRPFTGARLVGSFRDLGFWRTPAESLKMRVAAPFYHGFVANSEAVKTAFAAADHIAPQRIAVIRNGMDLTGIQARSADPSRPAIVGIVANLNRPVKRVQDFVEAAALVAARQPTARFVIIGDGHLRPELERLARERGVADLIEFTGRLADPGTRIHSFDVGVITSETEGFCNAIIEYMAHGVPVVATNTGGNPEIVRDGVHGYLCPVADPPALASAILKLLDDRATAQQMARTNAELIRREYTLERMIERQSDYYDKILAS